MLKEFQSRKLWDSLKPFGESISDFNKIHPPRKIFAGDDLLSGGVVVFFDQFVRALFKGVHVLIVDLQLITFVLDVHAGDLVFIHVDLPQETIFQIHFIPRCQDVGIVYLPQIGKILAFIDFLFDLR